MSLFFTLILLLQLIFLAFDLIFQILYLLPARETSLSPSDWFPPALPLCSHDLVILSLLHPKLLDGAVALQLLLRELLSFKQ